MAFVTLGCHPARAYPGIRGNIGIEACQIGIRAWFVQSILRILFYSRKVLVLTSFGCHYFRILCQLVQLCKSLSDWIVTFWLKFKNSCRDCASSVTCLICWTTLSIRLILYDVHPLGMMVRVSITWKRRVLEISIWGILVKTNRRFEMAMPLCNMRSLGIEGGVGSTSKF